MTECRADVGAAPPTAGASADVPNAYSQVSQARLGQRSSAAPGHSHGIRPLRSRLHPALRRPLRHTAPGPRRDTRCHEALISGHDEHQPPPIKPDDATNPRTAPGSPSMTSSCRWRWLPTGGCRPDRPTVATNALRWGPGPGQRGDQRQCGRGLAEFDRMVMRRATHGAAEAWKPRQANFADGDGRLPQPPDDPGRFWTPSGSPRTSSIPTMRQPRHRNRSRDATDSDCSRLPSS
jgi:hypothetical protein